MNIASRIRHSFLGKVARGGLHCAYRLRNLGGKPVKYCLPGGVTVLLHPEGEIAEFLFVKRFFENAEIALTTTYLKPGMTMIDVGANVGVYSILAQRLVGEAGVVWAFEPSSESFRRLRNNLDLNKCKSVRPVQVALTNKANGVLMLQADSGFGDAYRYLVSSDKVSDNGESGELVPVTTLDQFAENNGIVDVNYIKVDVEGGEYDVLQGATNLLASNPDVCIMFESEADWCKRAGCRQQDAFDLLKRLGFGLYSWRARTGEWISSEAALLNSGTVWATRDAGKLPVL